MVLEIPVFEKPRLDIFRGFLWGCCPVWEITKNIIFSGCLNSGTNLQTIISEETEFYTYFFLGLNFNFEKPLKRSILKFHVKD